MRVVIAPDSFAGTLDPVAAAEAIAQGWRDAGGLEDELVLVPLSDGGEGLLVAVEYAARQAGRAVVRRTTEVVDPRGLAVDADWLLLDGGEVAVIESATASGISLLAPERRDPRMTTTWGVGQLLSAAAAAGARRVLLGLGGSATVDGGAGALSGLGFRLTVEDGSGLKIGGEDLSRVADIATGWADPAVLALDEVVLLADVQTVLGDSAATFGPQKGADEAAVSHLADGLAAWADVIEGAFDRPGLREVPGSGAAGGLGFGLAAALGATFSRGAEAVSELAGLRAAVRDADLVIAGEGRLDATSFVGKVVGTVVESAGDVPVALVCGQREAGERADAFVAVETCGAHSPGVDPAPALREAAGRLRAVINRDRQTGHGPR